MYAQIIPLVRLPRRFAFFDYLIPEGLEVHVGDIVLIPLKGRDVEGIVRSVSMTTEFDRISSIKSVIKTAFLTSADIERLERIAQCILQSPSTVFTAALQGITHSRVVAQQMPQTHSGSIDKATAEVVRKTLSQSLPLTKGEMEGVSHASSIETSLEGCITTIRLAAQQSKNQMLVLCPRERDVDIISRFLPKEQARLHGHTPLAQRRWILENWRSGHFKLLIGTRQASLLPAQSIDTIIIFDPHSEDHVSYNRNPRYDARRAAELLAKQHQAKLIKCGALAELLDDKVFYSPTDSSNIIDLNDKREKIGLPLISESLVSAISDALQNGKKVLISYNAKGVAKRLQCSSCHHIPLCGSCGSQPHVRLDDLVCPVCHAEMWIPKTCPACGKATLTTRGIGNKRIAAELKKRFAQATIELIDKEHSQSSDADIQIVTEHYFQSVYLPFPTERFGLIAELMAEKSLGSDYQSSVTTAYRLHRLMHMAHHHKANVIIQTWMPDVIKPMLDSDVFRSSEMRLREQYHLPPLVDQFDLSGDRDVVANLDTPPYEGGDGGGRQTIIRDIRDRASTIKELKNLPDSVTIQTTYSSYENPSDHHRS